MNLAITKKNGIVQLLRKCAVPLHTKHLQTRVNRTTSTDTYCVTKAALATGLANQAILGRAVSLLQDFSHTNHAICCRPLFITGQQNANLAGMIRVRLNKRFYSGHHGCHRTFHINGATTK